MNATTPLPPAEDPPADSASGYRPPPLGPRRLTRSTDEHMIAGVCGGVAEYLRVDPTIVRIAAIVLACFGIGIVAYLVGWAVLPEGPGAPNPTPGEWLVPASLLLALAAFGIFGIFDGDFDLVGVALVMLGIGAVLVWGGRGDGPGSGHGSGTDLSPTPFSGASTGTVPAEAPKDELPPPPPPPPPAPPQVPPVPPVPPRDRHRRRARFWRSFVICVGGLFIAAGAFSAAVVLSEDVAPTVVLGASLAVLGAVIAAGAWYGGTRPLIPAGVLLMLGVATVAIVDVPLEGGFADRTIVPGVVSAIPTEERLTAGRLVIDLSQVDLTGDERLLEASVGAGELVVVVPATTTIEIRADVGLGHLDVLGRERHGVGAELDQVIEGTSPQRIELDLQVGVGELEVRRAA